MDIQAAFNQLAGLITSNQAKNDKQFQELKADNQILKADNQILKADNQILKEKMVGLEEANLRLEAANLRLEAEVVRLTEENKILAARITTIEERLNLIDDRLKGIAPFVREVLEEELSLLLDPEYFNSMRDEEDIESFYSSKEIITNEANVETLLNSFKNEKGLTQAFGKRIKQFYETVTGYLPRKENNKYMYWLEAEEIIVNNVLRLFNEVFV